MPETWCQACGFRIDPLNESQVLCPACGADPYNPMLPRDDREVAPAFDDGAAFIDDPVPMTEALGGDASVYPEIDCMPDPDLELMIADAEAVMLALTHGPILIAGNKLVH